MKSVRPSRSRLAVAACLAIALATTTGTFAASAVAAVLKPPAALKVLIPSPFSKASQAPGTFTGDANEWAVGIVAGKSEALVYLCDGKTPGQWFGATIKNLQTPPSGMTELSIPRRSSR